MSNHGKIKVITHLNVMRLQKNLTPMGILGKDIDFPDLDSPFRQDRVRVSWYDERCFSFPLTPDEVHHFETLSGEVLLYAIIDGKICGMQSQRPTDAERQQNKNPVRRWLRSQFPLLVPTRRLKLEERITDFDFLIPLNDAHLIMDVFKVNRENKSYQRWRRDDGLRHSDLIDVLEKTGKILFVDWRECLDDAVSQIQKQLLIYDVELLADLQESEPEGQISIDGCSESICFNPSRNDCDFDPVVASINKLAAGKVEYRRLRYCEGSDEYDYAFLSEKEWQTLEEALPELTDKLFAVAGSPYRY